MELKERIKICIVLFLLVIFALPFLGCVPQKDKGNLEISFIELDGAKTLTPSISINVDYYIVEGAGPYGESFSKTIYSSPFEIEYLEHGEWAITVDAYNESGIRVAAGTSSTMIVAGETVSLYIQLSPPDGTGTLSIDIFWDDTVVSNPAIQSSLISGGGTTIPMTASIVSSGHADINEPNLATGYYTCSIQLLDSEVVVAGAVEAVCILDAQETQGEFYFNNPNIPSGDVEIIIDTDLEEPLIINLSGTVDTFLHGQTMTVLVDAGTITDVTYSWYINGTYMASGETYITDSGLAPGYYRLDVIGFSADNKRSGSASHTFIVTEN